MAVNPGSTITWLWDLGNIVFPSPTWRCINSGSSLKEFSDSLKLAYCPPPWGEAADTFMKSCRRTGESLGNSLLLWESLALSPCSPVQTSLGLFLVRSPLWSPVDWWPSQHSFSRTSSGYSCFHLTCCSLCKLGSCYGCKNPKPGSWPQKWSINTMKVFCTTFLSAGHKGYRGPDLTNVLVGIHRLTCHCGGCDAAFHFVVVNFGNKTKHIRWNLPS